MPEKETPLSQLSLFLPEGSVPDVLNYLHQYKVHLTITRERSTVLGNYRNKIFKKNHRISVNGNLNKYSFLITLLHELAHLLANEKYGHTIQPHGQHWKKEYATILSQFIAKKIFPHDIQNVLLQSLKNPAASSCADEKLIRVLRKYDPRQESIFLVEELVAGALFKTKDGRVFKKGERMRKRFKCLEIASKKLYLFSPVYEVELMA
ncbi:MAG: SprT-like domain-containing protein [Chitinophagaceae bacterium]|nr:SprT-like domain-containing protein [Chitinophagaceae bacterium]